MNSDKMSFFAMVVALFIAMFIQFTKSAFFALALLVFGWTCILHNHTDWSFILAMVLAPVTMFGTALVTALFFRKAIGRQFGR